MHRCNTVNLLQSPWYATPIKRPLPSLSQTLYPLVHSFHSSIVTPYFPEQCKMVKIPNGGRGRGDSSVNKVLCFENLSLIPRIHVNPCVWLVIPALGKLSRAHWQSQSSLTGKWQATERHCLKEGWYFFLRIPEIMLWPPHACKPHLHRPYKHMSLHIQQEQHSSNNDNIFTPGSGGPHL